MRQALDELSAVAELLERGQADTPIGDEIARIKSLGSVRPVRVLVLGSDPAYVTRAAGWFDGVRDAQVFAPSIDDLRAEALRLGSYPDPLLVVVASATGEPLTAAQSETLNILIAAERPVWRVNFAEAPSSSAPVRHIGAGANEIALPPVTVGPDPAAPPHLLQGPREADARRMLSALDQAHRAKAAAELIQDRHDTELRSLQARQKREQAAERATESPAGDLASRQNFEGLPARISADLNRLNQELRDNGRRAGLRTGEIFTLVDEMLANLRDHDIAQEVAGKKIRLSLKPEVIDELKEQFAHALRQQIEMDCACIAATAETSRQAIDEAALRLGLTQRAPADLETLVDQVWAPIEEGLHLQVRYRGEMKRRSFLNRLGEGRRILFVILMAGSLVGGFMGFNIRRNTALGPVFLAVFIAVVAYTFYSWKQEEKLGFEEELIRLRDLLSAEFARLLSDALRERQNRLLAAVEDLRRQTQAVVDTMQRETGAARNQQADGQRKAARARLKVVEARLRDMQPATPAMARVRTALERAVFDARRELENIALGRPVPGAPAPRPAE